jgi:uncharacterized protein
VTAAGSGDVAARITAFLDTHHVMSLAICGPHGPHAANVFYVRDRFALLWVSNPQTRHSLALETDRHVSVTIAPDYRDFDEIRGVQISGDAHRITGTTERRRARRLLEARYPFLQRLSELPLVKQAYESGQLYRLVPREIEMIDNTRGFGHRDVLDLRSRE